MIEDDGGEIAVYTIIHIQHITRGIQRRIDHRASRGNQTRKRESRGNVVPTGFTDDTDGRGEILVERGGEHSGHGLEGLGAVAPAHVEGVHVEPETGCLVEDESRVLDGFEEGVRIACAGTDVECHTDDIETKFLGQFQQLLSRIQWRTKLHAQSAQGRRIIRLDTQIQLSIRAELLGLVEFLGIVKGDLLDAVLGGVLEVGGDLAWLGEDDAGGIDAHFEDLLDLGFGGTVEAGAKGGEEAKDLRVWIALDRIVWLDTRQIELPAQMLAIDFAQISYKEGILIADFAVLRINISNTLCESLPNQLVRARLLDHAMMEVGIGESWTK